MLVFENAQQINIYGNMHASLTVPFVTNAGIKVLGVPVHHPERANFGKEMWAKALDNWEVLLGKVTAFRDTQIVHHLLRTCLSACKVTHLLRASHT